MRLRLVLTLAYGVFLGAWVYADQKEPGKVLGVLPASVPLELSVLVLAIVVGFVVRRSWVLLALLGPLLSLGYLQVTGYVSPWHDGTDPLLSPPGISLFFWFAIALLIGVGIGHLQGRTSSARIGRWSESGRSSTP